MCFSLNARFHLACRLFYSSVMVGRHVTRKNGNHRSSTFPLLRGFPRYYVGHRDVTREHTSEDGWQTTLVSIAARMRVDSRMGLTRRREACMLYIRSLASFYIFGGSRKKRNSAETFVNHACFDCAYSASSFAKMWQTENVCASQPSFRYRC